MYQFLLGKNKKKVKTLPNNFHSFLRHAQKIPRILFTARRGLSGSQERHSCLQGRNNVWKSHIYFGDMVVQDSGLKSVKLVLPHDKLVMQNE